MLVPIRLRHGVRIHPTSYQMTADLVARHAAQHVSTSHLDFYSPHVSIWVVQRPSYKPYLDVLSTHSCIARLQCDVCSCPFRFSRSYCKHITEHYSLALSHTARALSFMRPARFQRRVLCLYTGLLSNDWQVLQSLPSGLHHILNEPPPPT